MLLWALKFVHRLKNHKYQSASKDGSNPTDGSLDQMKELKLRWNPYNQQESGRQQKNPSTQVHVLDNRPFAIRNPASWYPLSKKRGSFYIRRPALLSPGWDAVAQQARDIFNQFDSDKSGSLDPIAFKKFLRAAGALTGLNDVKSFTKLAKQDYRKLVQGRGSENRCESISFDAFLRYYRFMVESNKGPTSDKRHSHDVNDNIDGLVTGRREAVLLNSNTKDTIWLGGLPPIVVAASHGDLKLVIKLATDPHQCRTLLPSERAAVLREAEAGNVPRTQAIVRDLFTRAMQRHPVVEALVNEDVDVAKDKLKEIYFSTTALPMSHDYRGSNIDTGKKRKKPQKLLPFVLGQRLAHACSKKTNRGFARVQKLITDGVDVNWQDANGSTGLMHASWFGNITIVRALLEAGADCTIVNRRGNSPVHFAAEKNNTELIYTFIDWSGGAGLNILRTANAIGKTPIDLCSDAFVKDICEHAAAGAEAGDGGVTIIKNADRDASSSQATIIRPRRGRGGGYNNDILSCSKDGYVGKMDDLVRSACRKGNLQLLTHLVKTGLGDMKNPDRYSIFPLMHAVHSRKAKVVRFMLAQGAADVFATTRNGNTALHFACQQHRLHKNKLIDQINCRQIIKMLLKAGEERLLAVHNRHGKIATDPNICSSE